MDHRPFEDWLLDNQPLTMDQKRQLNPHLRTCSSCAALAGVNLALKSVGVAAPAAGFAYRFQVRLAAKKQALRRRNFWGFVVLTLSVLGLFGWVSWPVLKDLIQSPVNLLASWISSLVSFWASLQAIFRAGMVLFKVVPGFVPAYIWAVILFAAGGWSLVWVVSLMKFTKYPQGA
ncbi:MAG: hypothetical protein NTW99_02795 [Chloroflexi bacterium]|nr:hypothetical protein [Chloroflexota bacterium]